MRPPILLSALVASFFVSSAFAQWKPAKNSMLTEWGKKLDPTKVWIEYPRPQLVRSNWTNLNGMWDFAVTSKGAPQPTEWTQRILVPFAPEAPLSGVGRIIEPSEEVWYRRPLPAPTAGMRTRLNFEAVDYDTTVWVNGTEVGTHRGGSTPFSFDITDALKPGDNNELVVRAYDATEDYQINGKQRLHATGIFYTRVTGIWQTVWLEQVPDRWIEDIDYACDIRTGTVTVDTKLSGEPVAGETVKLTASFGGKEVATATGTGKVELKIPDAKLWAPGSPNLYDITAQVVDASGKVIDTVKSYTALREVGQVRDAAGHLRFTLNGRPIFHWGPLDQGWWPDGLLTPPSEEAMLFDVKYVQDAGFNMIRKHIKIEPRRFYYDCDRLGMLVWQDQISGGPSPRWTFLDPNPEDASWPDEHHEQWVLEYKRMVDLLRDHPSIVVWTPFNEAWGQHRTVEVGKMAMEYDPTRLINIASGGNFHPVGHIADKHEYPHPGFPLGDPRFDDYIKVVGEFGGHGFPVKGHVWDPTKENWGYGGLPGSIEEWRQRYERSIDVLSRLRQLGVAGGVYTQTTDVEGEINGLLTYDRLPKTDIAWLKSMSRKLYAANGLLEVRELVPTSEKEPQAWRYTETKPAAGWEKTVFDDAGWNQGEGGFGVQDNPNMKVRTEWRSSDIWLRRKFTLQTRPTGQPVLRIFHDNAATVYLNGVKVAELSGHVNEYVSVALDDPKALKSGENVLAVHCNQTDGGQYIDVGLSDEVVVNP